MDLRNFIGLNINDYNRDVILDNGLIEKLGRRSNNYGFIENDPILLIEYLDFGDSINLLNKFTGFFPNSFKESISKLSRELDKITPVRNRVMHSRPLEFEDFPLLADFLNIIDRFDFIEWTQTRDLKEKLEHDPSIILNVNISNFVEVSNDKVFHNLPSVEFDDTGFIGRSNDRKDIIAKLKGNYPVITIIGEGGVGKTALTLRCLYDLIDDPYQPFDAIIWVSLKTTVLNNGEFRNIAYAIKTTIDMFNFIGKSLISESLEIGEGIQNEILDYMSQFNILLVLDNLETINTEQIREFIQKLPVGSKLLITSRIGIGEFESRHPIAGLNPQEAGYYLRRLGQNQKLEVIQKLSEHSINRIGSRLYYNPLAIKWFVANVLKGEPIESVLSHKEDLLNYCMSNVYEKLSENAREMLEALLIVNRKCSDAELEYLLGFESILHRKALNELISTNMVRMETISNNDSVRTTFYVTEFAKDYLLSQYPPSPNSFKRITKKLNQLKGLSQNLKLELDNNPYSLKSIIVEHEDEKIAAYYLKEALKLSYDRQNQQNMKKAFEYIEKAKAAISNYYESYKIAGFIRASQNDIYKADEEYRAALECKRDYAPLMFFYAGFRLIHLEDFEGALEWNNNAEKLDQDNIEIKIQKGRILKQLGRFEDANDVFSDILSRDVSLTLKQRKITIDQASDNLRRWADNKISKEDYRRALGLLETSIKITSSLEEKDQDYKILTTLSRIISVLTYVISGGQTESSKKATDMLVHTLKQFGSRIWNLKTYPDIRKRLESILYILSDEHRAFIVSYIERNPENLIDSISGANEGIIFSKYPVYSFIVNREFDKFNKLYLYWKDFKGDYISLSIGDKVIFEIGENDKGPCAKSVRLL